MDGYSDPIGITAPCPARPPRMQRRVRACEHAAACLPASLGYVDAPGSLPPHLEHQRGRCRAISLSKTEEPRRLSLSNSPHSVHLKSN